MLSSVTSSLLPARNVYLVVCLARSTQCMYLFGVYGEGRGPNSAHQRKLEGKTEGNGREEDRKRKEKRQATLLG